MSARACKHVKDDGERDAEIRRMARELDQTEDEVRAEFKVEIAAIERVK